MDVAAALIVTFMLLMLSVYRGINILHPLLVGLIIFIVVAYKEIISQKKLLA